MTKRDEVQPIEKFRELVGEFDDAMLVSADGQGQLHGRPMRLVTGKEHGDELWFVSGRDAGKIAEIGGDPRIAVILADGKRFVSISGDARVVDDPGKLAAVWEEGWKRWFPEGPAGGNMALIQVRPTRAEYWDHSFPKGIRYAVAATKAWLKGEKIEEPDSPDQHAKVQL